jgi:hypothetical protein
MVRVHGLIYGEGRMVMMVNLKYGIVVQLEREN